MSSTYGDFLKLTIFGQSHGPAIGMTLDGIPAGLPIDLDALNCFLARRAPGNNAYSTPRKESDIPEFLSGIHNGHTCGAPICAVIYNTNAHSSDYDSLKDCPRPGHADYTAQVKYGGYQDAAGGGHFSGRLTAALCIAGGLCKQWLAQKGITIQAHVYAIGDIFDKVTPGAPLSLCSEFPTVSRESGAAMQALIAKVKESGDSIGGQIACVIEGVPVGLGEPMFGGMESKLAQILYGIPAVKALEFGDGMAVSAMRGSQCNDPFVIKNGIVCTETNHCGGILGGITNGMPLAFRVGVKPTPSIAVQQQSVSLSRMKATSLQVHGRHDPCIVPRAVPVVEAAAAIAIYDAYLSQTNRR